MLLLTVSQAFLFKHIVYMENNSTNVLTGSALGLTILQKGNSIETYNKKGELIHLIENKEAANRILIHRWFGSATNEEVKAIFDGHFYEYLQQQGLTKILVDTSAMNGFFDGVNNWLAKYYFPKLLSIGVKYNAFLLSEEFYAELAADGTDQGMHGYLITRMFGSEEKALYWLNNSN